MITDDVYREYLSLLLTGNKPGCAKIVQTLINNNIDIETLYLSLFKRSLYEIGDLWAANKVSVATEHICTAITENLMTLAHPLIFRKINSSNRAIVACVANEYHQIGGKMVADILELYGWDTYFLGANVPIDALINLIQETTPQLLCLSLSVALHRDHLDNTIKMVKEKWPALPVFVGGKAFEFDAVIDVELYPKVTIINSLENLKLELLRLGDNPGKS